MTLVSYVVPKIITVIIMLKLLYKYKTEVLYEPQKWKNYLEILHLFSLKSAPFRILSVVYEITIVDEINRRMPICSNF